ncbi:uncharacterized protein LOC142563199 [Dermacentor variabilis]|uniref:uncharacterized protein LOC142563199 n=1 Tax=Dermacentor variabilis TaxID=34621 RepID=UPI003F5B680E
MVRLMIDGGSQRTFVKKEVSQKMELRVMGEETLKIMTFGNDKPSSGMKCRRVELWLCSRHSRKKIRVEALEIPQICCDIVPAPEASTANYLEEQALELADSTQDGAEMLGSDYYWEVTTGGVRRLDSGLVAVETIFGWTLQGTTHTTESTATYVSTVGVLRVAVIGEEDQDDTAAQLKSFWQLEHIGIVDEGEADVEDNQVLRKFRENVSSNNCRYQVSLPWKENAGDLADNKATAFSRLRSLTTKLMGNNDLMRDYDQAIRNYLQAGHAEEANELGESPLGPIYYMPHRGVVRPGSETTKLRVVFDASSKAAGKLLLNDVLFAGPNLNSNLADILIRFRVHNVAIMSDIEKAFLQIELAESERDAVRFLWYQSTPGQSDALPPIKEYRMRRVPFGVTCSPFLLAATLSHHLKTVQEKFPRTAKILSDNLYVDDLVTGADSVEEAERVIRESQSILKAAGMNLRKWRSNYPELIASFAETESAQKTLPELGPTKILGVEWRPDTDEFVFEMTALIGFLASRQDTKRFVLQASKRIFHPFGFLSAITITAKIMFQSLWERDTSPKNIGS